MNDALDPIRHVYDEADGTPPPTPGTPQHAELAWLRTMQAVLDRWPRLRPDAVVLGAVNAAAASHALRPLRAAYGEADALAPDDPRQAEAAFFATMRAVLEQQPRPRPDADTLAAVNIAAQAATLAPLRHAYGEADGRPPAPGDAQHAEYALLASARTALNQLPRPRPDAAVVSAIVAEAARAARTDTPSRGAPDRPARPQGVRRRWVGWVGTAAMLAIVAFSGVWIVTQTPANEAMQAPSFAGTDQAAPSAQDTEASASELEEEAPFLAVAPSNEPTVAPDRRPATPPPAEASGRRTDTRAERASGPPPAAPSPVVQGDFADEAAPSVALAERQNAAGLDADVLMEAAEWEAGEDVRVLSLRLQQLATSSEGLAWDEPPVPLGAASGQTGGAGALSNEIQPVSTMTGPANVEVRMRTRAQQDR
ncbi:MAG: hypothetical protein HKN04_05185 [Rhodothermaceae bacterium]|nr:hypothetical protein [Rhodothermaceae bacterium]